MTSPSKEYLPICELVTKAVYSPHYRGDIIKDSKLMVDAGYLTKHERSRLMSTIKGLIKRSAFTQGLPTDFPFEGLVPLMKEGLTAGHLLDNWDQRFELIPKKEAGAFGRMNVILMDTIVYPLMKETGVTFYDAIYDLYSRDVITRYELVRLKAAYRRYVHKLIDDLVIRPDIKLELNAVRDTISIERVLAYYHKKGIALNWSELRIINDWGTKWYVSRHNHSVKLRQELRSTRV